ncbi:MAG: carbon starvation protein A [Planctomycetes bacterium]|nr:carbon starvation protein A [Planctomycetota bacterium]MCG2683028.1 carbon starvation protein A [Planctomycetales bacterium]
MSGHRVHPVAVVETLAARYGCGRAASRLAEAVAWKGGRGVLDNAAFVAIGSFAVLAAAYFTYGRFIARRVYRLDADRVTPAHSMRDNIDYVPTRIPILFGHHFASIAGLGPILGPAIAVIWGWGPAVLWILIGSIFIGAVHDLGALTVSLRYQGRSIGEVCHHLMGGRARILALLIIFFMMSLAMGAFCSIISNLFVNFHPDAIIPSFGLMAVAIGVGISVYRLRFPLGLTTAAALVLFAGLIFWGVERPVCTYRWFLEPDTRAALDAAPAPGVPAFELPYGAAAAMTHLKAVGDEAAAADVQSVVPNAQLGWIGVLLLYGFLASVLPVWLLLQPRDYINSFQLYFVLTTMLLGILIAGWTGAAENHIEAPMFRSGVPDAPSIFPFLFVTVACGAVSGFHSLVSSGTTVKQLNRESDALPIGYGAMLVEGALAVLVILACAAGLGATSWAPGGVYSSWKGIAGGELSAVVRGGANFLAQLGIPTSHGRTVLAVTIVAFAMTTLDSATRLLRFNVEEMSRALRFRLLANRYVASAVAVSGIAFFALVPAGKTLWILFGTTNQLLAGLTLLAVSVFLFKLRRAIVYTIIPMAIMLVFSAWAMVLSLCKFWTQGQWSLAVVSIIVLAMSLWLAVEAAISFRRGRGGIDLDGEPQPIPAEEQAAIDAAHLG